MKLKYYLRGLGIGIIVTTVILAVSFSKKEIKMSDEEIMARAAQLGMVKQEAADAENPSGVYRLVIQKGDVCRIVCEKLAENGVISDAETFRQYLSQIGYASNMRVGNYDIPYGLSNEEIAKILQAGPLEE